MECLQAEKYPGAIGLLNQALGLLNKLPSAHRSLLALTYNNIGCYYKRLGKFKAALKYLRSALKIEAGTSAESTDVAGTHLNICAILSKLKQHSTAYRHAIAALSLLSEVKPSPSYLSTLVIAFHNAGTELEFLQEYSEAMQAYHSGLKLAEKNLGASHALTTSLQKSFDGIKNKLIESRAGKRSKSNGVRIPPGNCLSKLNRTLPKLHTSDLSESIRQVSTEDSRHKPLTAHSPRGKLVDLKWTFAKPRPKSQDHYYTKHARNILSRPATRTSAIGKINKAALVIQKWWRGLRSKLARPTSKRRKPKSRQLTHQSPGPNGKPRDLRNPKRAVTLNLQAKENDRGPNLKILLIKSRLKDFMTTRKANVQVQAAIMIQKTFRMWQSRKLYLGIKEAIIYIQQAYRAYRQTASVK